MAGFVVPPMARQQLFAGTVTVITVTSMLGTITITFPSSRFCSKYVDDDFLNAVLNKICGQPTTDKGNGEVSVGNYARCGHVKTVGGEAVGWDWGPGMGSPQTIFIRGYGTKGGRGAAAKGSGGYTWET